MFRERTSRRRVQKSDPPATTPGCRLHEMESILKVAILVSFRCDLNGHRPQPARQAFSSYGLSHDETRAEF